MDELLKLAMDVVQAENRINIATLNKDRAEKMIHLDIATIELGEAKRRYQIGLNAFMESRDSYES